MAGVEQAPATAPSPARGPDTSSAIKKPDVQRNVKEASINAEKVRQINTSLHQRQEMSAQEIGKVQQQINEVVETLNKYLKFSPSDLNFAVDEISNRFMVTVSNEDTGEVIRQVPAEAVLRVAHNIEKLKGLIFDKTL